MTNTKLNNLTPEEKRAVAQILKEYSTEGKSESLSLLLDEDWDETPVDIITFMHERKYLGNGLIDSEGRYTIFPYWEKKLKEIFPTNTTTAYNTLVLTGCLAGDTVIPLLNGNNVKIKDLAEIGDLDEYVYSYDVESNSYVPGHLIKAFSTGVKPIYEIELDNHTVIKATSNHRFMTRDKHWKSIDSGLSPGDSMIPFNRGSKLISVKREDSKELYNQDINYNREIIRITFVGYEEVYDLTVEKYHNFAIDKGIIAHNSIGIGKTMIGCVCLLYMLYRLLCLKDPYLYYGMQPIDKISISLMNITIENARGVAMDKINQLILSSEWFMSHGKMSGTTNLEYIPNKHIELIAGSSNNQVIGRCIFCLGAETKVYTSEGIYKISDLIDKKSRFLTYDGDKLKYSEPCEVKVTGETNEKYQLELEDGTIIECTPNHKFLLKNGTYKEAKDLTEDDELFFEEIKK